MSTGIWGRKIGMTQVFSEDKQVIPVTVIDTSHWMVVQVKTPEKDGYRAIKVGLLREEFHDKEFSKEWLKKLRTYFLVVRELASAENHGFEVGQKISLQGFMPGDKIDVVGTTIGRGFQGAMKRHGFSGGRASHGDKLGRGPGSLSFMRRQGRVRKGKKLPGHMGVTRRMMKKLNVVRVEPDNNIIFIKGSLPGKTGSLVCMMKD